MGTALSGFDMTDFWAVVTDIWSLAIVVGLVALGLGLKYGKRIIKFVKSV